MSALIASLTGRPAFGPPRGRTSRSPGLGSAIRRVGPAVIASIAYMDPGNFATNIQAGSRFGYSLLWVVVAASLVAMLFQALSARLGIVTGRALINPPGLNAQALLIAVGIVGATVRPHTIYLHSGLTQAREPARTDHQRRALVSFSNREVIAALSVAGLVNIAMVLLAAAAFHGQRPDVAAIDTAWRALGALLGPVAAGVFLVSLIASGLSSSTVATMAGQTIMQGFVGFRIPIWLRRLITMAPAFAVIALGVDPTRALVISQVVLSFALPAPMIALVILTRREEVMGAFANGPLIHAVAIGATAVVLALNGVLLAQTLGVPMAWPL